MRENDELILVLRVRHPQASILRDSLTPDDTEWISSRVEGDVLEVKFRAGNPRTLLAMVDDYLVNLKTAMDSLNSIHKSNSG